MGKGTGKERNYARSLLNTLSVTLIEKMGLFWSEERGDAVESFLQLLPLDAYPYGLPLLDAMLMIARSARPGVIREITTWAQQLLPENLRTRKSLAPRNTAWTVATMFRRVAAVAPEQRPHVIPYVQRLLSSQEDNYFDAVVFAFDTVAGCYEQAGPKIMGDIESWINRHHNGTENKIDVFMDIARMYTDPDRSRRRAGYLHWVAEAPEGSREREEREQFAARWMPDEYTQNTKEKQAQDLLQLLKASGNMLGTPESAENIAFMFQLVERLYRIPVADLQTSQQPEST